MKISIIVFSPSGHTLKAAQMFKQAFEIEEIKVQLINITKDSTYLYNQNLRKRLEETLEEHDVLLIGGPVYAGHVEQNILCVIESLPKVTKGFGRLAVPFVTYGGVHSSIALEEMGRYLKKQNRQSILAVKIAAEHTLTKTLANRINTKKPGAYEEAIIEEAVSRIMSVTNQDQEMIKDMSKTFKYAKLPERILFNLFDQEAFHKKFKTVSVNAQKCIGCKKCVLACPMNMFELSNKTAKVVRSKSDCILCAECFHVCPSEAINYNYIEMASKRLEDGYVKLEEEATCIYPKR